MIGKRARFIVLGIEAEPRHNGTSVTKALTPLRGEGRLSVAGRGSEQDQAARSCAVEELEQSRSLNRELADSRRHSLGQSNTRKLNQDGMTSLLCQAHLTHLRALPRTEFFVPSQRGC